MIDKPAGLAVHAGPSKAPNLEECFDALRFGLPRPPALAHRLDADTSGVLVLGRHPKALSKLGRLFSGRDTEKTYWAVVQGAPPADEGVFDQKLLKVNTRSGWSVKVSDKGQTAVTRYKVLGRGPDMTWLELKPETGRTHQIRVHCAAAGCPVIADRLYGTAEPGQHASPAFARHRAAAVEEQAAGRGRSATAGAHDRSAESMRLQGYVRVGLAERQTRSRSPRLSGNPCKSLMPLVLPALVAAGRCRMNSDRNDIARSSARRVGWPTNSDSYASFAMVFRHRPFADGLGAVRDGYRMNDA